MTWGSTVSTPEGWTSSQVDGRTVIVPSVRSGSSARGVIGFPGCEPTLIRKKSGSRQLPVLSRQGPAPHRPRRLTEQDNDGVDQRQCS